MTVVTMESPKCHECEGRAEYILVNGEERVKYCKFCIADECGSMAVQNDSICFRQEKGDDGMTLMICT
jgi:hypothetical protein